ncbi:sericin-2-like isoform X2 [Agelaius tricolor]|uniref:sericin-2-like isoform X2 n=1 Tax=Agelaius tricolor TaxID=9191 RepID=UPI0039F1D27D
MMERLEPAGSVGERRGLIPAAAAGGDAPLSPRDRAGDGGSSRGTAGTALGSGAAPAWEQGSARGQLLGAGLGSGAAPAGCGWRSTSLSSSSSSSASSSSCARNPASHGGDPGRPCSPAGAALAQTPRHGRDAEMPERILGATLLRGEGMGGNSPAHHTSPSRAPATGSKGSSAPFSALICSPSAPPDKMRFKRPIKSGRKQRTDAVCAWDGSTAPGSPWAAAPARQSSVLQCPPDLPIACSSFSRVMSQAELALQLLRTKGSLKSAKEDFESDQAHPPNEGD